MHRPTGPQTAATLQPWELAAAAHHVKKRGKTQRVEAILLSDVALQLRRRVEHRRDLPYARVCHSRAPLGSSALAAADAGPRRTFDLAIMVTWLAGVPVRPVAAWYALQTPQSASMDSVKRGRGAIAI